MDMTATMALILYSVFRSYDPIRTENAVDSLLAHVLVGEPDSTSPEHALLPRAPRIY